MNPNYTHDFSSASIKHLIEAEFYQKVGKSLDDKRHISTIVTGPDCQRHVDNYKKYISGYHLRICEINPLIYAEIYRAVNKKMVTIVCDSVENYGSIFIDCDLTCVSNIEAIKNTLIKQISVQSENCDINKAFIFSFGLRSNNIIKKTIYQYLKPILGLLGANVTHVVMSKVETPKAKGKGKGTGTYKYNITIGGDKGRIKDYICYKYDAGGGPMLTCLLIYK
jgi:hypothetical protein